MAALAALLCDPGGSLAVRSRLVEHADTAATASSANIASTFAVFGAAGLLVDQGVVGFSASPR